MSYDGLREMLDSEKLSYHGAGFLRIMNHPAAA
jgi:hypothetical protein